LGLGGYKMYETSLARISTKAGNCYEVPNGIDEEKYYNLIYEFIDLAKVKGLTVRQAQYLFDACNDYVLENKLV